MIDRILFDKIKDQCFKKKVIILIGPRQVGKTTLLKAIENTLNTSSIWLNADERDIREMINSADTSSQLKQLIGQHKLVIIDEAQQIDEIGLKLKLIHDNYPDIQIIATGSSAFELQNNMNEPLTGRKREFKMFPLSFEELVRHTSALEERRLLETRLIFGSYPEVINNPGQEEVILNELVDSYLFKDILKLDSVRKPATLEKLLTSLALQIGSEVNFNELAKTIGNIDPATVEKYIDLLEKTFIIFKLPALSRNYRNEIKKGKKYYFYDCGVRNNIIKNLNPLELRNDKGELWENYLISEKWKANAYQNNNLKTYFWRTKDQAEIDYLEDYGGTIHAYEMKWKTKSTRWPTSFISAYENHEKAYIDRENYHEFLMGK